MSNGLILVVGATGTQGGAVIDALLEDGVRVRALVRDSASGAAQRLRERGVELAVGDLEDVTSLKAALDGASGVFSVQLAPMPEEGSELRQGRNLVDAAVAAGVETFVHTSVARAGDQRNFVGWDDGRVWKAYWDEKSGVNDMVRAAGFKHWVILKPAIIMTNFVSPKADGMYPALKTSGVFETGIERETRLDMVDLADLAKLAAAAFADPDRFNGQELELAGDSVTLTEVATEITRVTGKPVTVQISTPEEAGARGVHPLAISSDEWHNQDGYRVDIAKANSYGFRLATFTEFADRHANDFAVGP